MKTVVTLITMIVICTALPAGADIINVPADQPTIQAGIDTAQDGDEVVVADRTYTGPNNRNLNFLGKAITVRSKNGPENCIINCARNGRGFIFNSGETNDSVVQGLTILNGHVDDGDGGGIHCYGSSPIILDNVISNCSAGDNLYHYRGGGGIACGNSSARIIGNTISECSADHGSGVYSDGPALTIADNDFVSNHCGFGAVYHVGGAASIYGNRFTNSHACGILVEANNAVIHSNLFSGNDIGVGVWATGVVVANNVIVGNDQGIYGLDYSFHIFNNLITDNLEQGILLYGSDAVIDCCTVAGNGGASEAGGLLAESCDVVIRNSIFWDNHGSGPELQTSIYGVSSIDISYSCVDGGTAFIEAENLTIGPGFIDTDPLFVPGPAGQFFLSQTAAGQAADSSCLDAGEDLAANTVLSTPELVLNLGDLSTRTDNQPDLGQADLGYHRVPCSGTVSCSLLCSPSFGTLPFDTQFSVMINNCYAGQARRIQYQVDVSLANGQLFPNWRRGWQNVHVGQSHVRSWWQTIPALASVNGRNDFTLTIWDVTPAPYNLPPYPPAGDNDMAMCSVTGN